METFANLSTVKKVEALLAVAKEPVSKQQIMNWLGVEDDMSGIDTMLSQFLVTSETEEPKYWIAPDKQEEAIQRLNVDSKSVHKRIVEIAFGKLGMKFE
jgi:hypothetical protein